MVIIEFNIDGDGATTAENKLTFDGSQLLFGSGLM